MAQITVTIPNGAALSGDINLPEHGAMTGILVPSAWTTAEITFQAKGADGSYGNVHDVAGTELTIPAASVVAGRVIAIDADGDGLRFGCLRLRSGTNATPVNQVPARMIVVFYELRG